MEINTAFFSTMTKYSLPEVEIIFDVVLLYTDSHFQPK